MTADSEQSTAVAEEPSPGAPGLSFHPAPQLDAVETTTSNSTPLKESKADEPPAPPEDVAEEIDAIDPQPQPGDTFTLSTGTKVRVVPLKARQFFALLRIITHGGTQVWGMFRLSPDMEQAEFLSQLLAMVLFAIPESEEESFDFIKSMLVPAEGEATRDRLTALGAEIDDCDLDDIVSIAEIVVQREGADMQALGKRLSGLMGLARKTGQLKGTPLSEASPGPST